MSETEFQFIFHLVLDWFLFCIGFILPYLCHLQAWKCIVDETREVSGLTQHRADLMSTSLKEKVDLLIQEKSKAKSQYISERHKIEDEFKKVLSASMNYLCTLQGHNINFGVVLNGFEL